MGNIEIVENLKLKKESLFNEIGKIIIGMWVGVDAGVGEVGRKEKREKEREKKERMKRRIKKEKREKREKRRRK